MKNTQLAVIALVGAFLAIAGCHNPFAPSRLSKPEAGAGADIPEGFGSVSIDLARGG